MRTMKTVYSAVLAAFLLAISAPLYAQSVAEEFIYYPAEPDEYYFFEETDKKKVAHFKKDRMVRVCVDKSEHLVPLKVIHDKDSSIVQPGDCLRFEAREVVLEPAAELSAKWLLKAEVDTMKTS